MFPGRERRVFTRTRSESEPAETTVAVIDSVKVVPGGT